MVVKATVEELGRPCWRTFECLVPARDDAQIVLSCRLSSVRGIARRSQTSQLKVASSTSSYSSPPYRNVDEGAVLLNGDELAGGSGVLRGYGLAAL